MGNLHALKPATPKEPHKAFKAYEPGYLHLDVKHLPQMGDETRRSYLFVAIDRATRWVFVAIKPDKTARSASSFLKVLRKACSPTRSVNRMGSMSLTGFARRWTSSTA